MNKKLFLLVAAAVAATSCALGLAACGHTHEMAYHAAESPTCTEEGNVEYWYCDGCGKYFADEEGSIEATISQLAISATGHTPADPVRENEVAATCTAEGSYDEVVYCEVCHKEVSRTPQTTDKLAHTYFDEWSHDDIYHWHAATCCDTGTVSDKAVHTVKGGTCTVCNAFVGTMGLEYTLSSDGTYYILSGIGESAEGDIFIPSKYNGLPVKEIGEGAFCECMSIQSVVISQGITSIGESAFYGCRGITSVTLPNGLESIGAYAFYECYALEGISIPESVKKMEAYALSRCMALESVVLPDSVTVVSNSMFADCGSLKSVTFGNAVTELEDYAFYACVAMTQIDIPDSVTSIGYAAFEYCTFKSITLPAGLKYLSDHMFEYCENLESVTLPEGLTYIGNDAFKMCTKLKSINIPQSVTEIGYSAFGGCMGLTEVVLPENLLKIGSSAFSACDNLKSVTMGSKVQFIDYLAFAYCYALTDIAFSGTMAEWEQIEKDADWDRDSVNYTVRCTDGDIAKKS